MEGKRKMSLIKKYPPPIKSKEFTSYWSMLLDEVVERPNFKEGHLLQLQTLCELYVEKNYLKNLIMAEGRTYRVNTRDGDQHKPRPELIMLNNVIDDIREYTKMLGLLLYKDTKVKEEEKEDEWG